jgi:cobalamin transport system ATP-binding protein
MTSETAPHDHTDEGRKAALSATHLEAGYRSGRHVRPVLSVASLAARAGDFVAVIGPNGTGKSTLLRTLIGSQPSLAGEVFLDGHRIDRLDRVERARRIAVVLTDRVDPGLLTVGDVVMLGRHPHTGWSGYLTRRDVDVSRSAARQLGVDHLWNQAFSELSDGQRQRTLVARALAQEPTVLVLDEPTAFLDIGGRIELTVTLAELAHGHRLAVIVATHDLDLALSHADRVWLVNDATVVDRAPVELTDDDSLAVAFTTPGLPAYVAGALRAALSRRS